MRKLGLMALLGGILLFGETVFPLRGAAQGPLVNQGIKGKVAVTPAGYDNMKPILEQMGYAPEEIPEAELANLDKLKTYAAIYINCSGSIESVTDEVGSAIKQYVSEGGVVYASDYSEAVVNKAFPGKIKFYSGAGLGETTSHVGNAGKVQAKVIDGGMAAALGKAAIEINFDLPSWVVMESATGRVYMRGPAPIIDYAAVFQNPQEWENIDFSKPESLEQFSLLTSKTLQDVPYVVSFAEGKGEVLFTSFHNEAQTTADVSKVLSWFTTRIEVSGIAQASRSLVSSGQAALLEIVDSINQGQKKAYSFESAGTDDFDLVLNFAGSALLLRLKDPKGKLVMNKEVAAPPYRESVTKPASGKYTVEIEGRDVPRANYPFVVTVLGKEGAVKNAVLAATATPTAATAGAANWANFKYWPYVGLGALVVIIVVVVFARRKKAKSPA